MGSIEFWWVLMGSDGFYQVLMGSIRFWWVLGVLVGSGGFWRVLGALVGSIGFWGFWGFWGLCYCSSRGGGTPPLTSSVN